jgi:hypothetical protein
MVVVVALVDCSRRRLGCRALPDLLDSHDSTNPPRLQIPARARIVHAAALPSPARGALKPALALASDRQRQRIDHDRHPTGSATTSS